MLQVFLLWACWQLLWQLPCKEGHGGRGKVRQAEVSGGQWAWPNANNQRVTFQFVNRRQIVCVARRLHKLLQRGNEASGQLASCCTVSSCCCCCCYLGAGNAHLSGQVELSLLCLFSLCSAINCLHIWQLGLTCQSGSWKRGGGVATAFH